MEFIDIFDASLCRAHITPTTKDALLQQGATLAAEHKSTDGIKAEHLYKLLKKREKESSTGFGDRLAIPHARVKGMKQFLCFLLTSKSGIPFDALDQKPVHLFFILLGPEEQVQEHLRHLAFLSRTIAKSNIKDVLLSETEDKKLYTRFVKVFQKNAPQRTETTTQQSATQAPSTSSLIVINLYQEELLEDILEILLEFDISGASIIDSIGMGQFLSQTPLFGNFIGTLRQNKYHSKTIMVIAPKQKVIPLFDEIERSIGSFEKSEAMSVFAIDVQTVRGSMNAI